MPMPGRAAYVLNAVRHQAALVLVPVILITGWMEAVGIGISKLPRMGMPAWLPPAAAQLVGMALVLTMMPLVLRRVWSTAVLGPGPLRERLTEMCVRQRVKVRELLVWGTHGTMINGAVMGFVGPVRYILLTDALLESLPQVQVEAVMAHELGHVKRKHMLWLGIASVSAITLAQLAINGGLWLVWGDRVLENDPAQAAAALAALLVGLWVFGFVSRRFEWQADAFAAQHLTEAGAGVASDSHDAGPQPQPLGLITEAATIAMAGALESVARLNRIPRDKFTWRHGSISTRQRKLVALSGQRIDRLAVDRQVRWLKAASLVAFVAAIAGIIATSGVLPQEPSESRHALRQDARHR
jgi:Zn-dependent protease with chaperone function